MRAHLIAAMDHEPRQHLDYNRKLTQGHPELK